MIDGGILIRRSMCTVLLLYCIGISDAQSQKVTDERKAYDAKLRLPGLAADTGKVRLLLFLSKFYLKKPGEIANDLDSALLLQGEAMQISNRLHFDWGTGHAMVLKGEIIDEKGDKPAGLKLLNEAVTFFDAHNLGQENGEAYVEISQHFSDEGSEFDQKIDYYKRAIACYKNAGEYLSEAQSLQMLGDLYQYRNRRQEALEPLLRSVALYDSIGYRETQGAYALLSWVYDQLGKNEQAMKYGLIAIKTAERLSDTGNWMSTVYYRVSVMYSDLNLVDTARQYEAKAMKIAIANKDTNAICTIKNGLAVTFRKQSRYLDALAELNSLVRGYGPLTASTWVDAAYSFFACYVNLNQLKKAGIYVDTLLSIRRRFPEITYYIPYADGAASRYYLETKQYARVYPYLREFKAYCRKIYNGPMYRYEISNELYWAKTDSALGRFDSAYYHFKLYKTYSDSVVNQENTKVLGQLQGQFETEKKDRNIATLEQQSILQKKQIRNEATIRYFTIAGAIMMIIFSALLYNRYRLKQRSNTRLEQQQRAINEQNALLKKVLGEKEWLLKEIHHRVKNNLQIVISLLNTQSAYLNDEPARIAIRDSQNRMYSMSLIHKKLYQSENLDSIEMSWYISELVKHIRDSFGAGKRIEFIMDLDKLELDVVQAVPLGLILNEAINNAIKYAFPGDAEGKVRVSLHHLGGGKYQLGISDNGVGFPEGYDQESNDSLGMDLMRGLSEQLDGRFAVVNDNGLTVTITFNKTDPFTDERKNTDS